MKSKNPIDQMTREQLEAELAENLRKHPYYKAGTKWSMRRFELRKALENKTSVFEKGEE